MDIFYIVVLTIAVFLLILVLTSLGLVMTARNNTAPFPPSKNTCPDFWDVVYDEATDAEHKHPKCKVPSNGVNAGKVTLSTSNTRGYNAGEIDFDHSDWGNVPGKTKQCAIHDWAVTNEIVWDGVSNFNGC